MMKEGNIGGILLALFILAWGIVWLGNDCGWWSFTFPVWPVVIILVGLGILIHELTRMKQR